MLQAYVLGYDSSLEEWRNYCSESNSYIAIWACFLKDLIKAQMS